MSVAEAEPENLDVVTDPHDRAFLGQPKGLGFLALVEGCERFSYYSMQTLLALYMVNYLLTPEQFGTVAGLGWLQNNWYDGKQGQVLASAIFGDYTALVYLTPILGGIVADKWLGRRGALVAGGLIMSLGHFLMAIQPAFLFALLCLIVGVGLFKGNIASQVGELYGPNDKRRAMAFQIFYIAIQLSVIAAPLISGTAGEKLGWHYGFGCAGVVMVIGLLVYLRARPYLPEDQRDRPKTAEKVKSFEKGDGMRIFALILLVPALAVTLLPNQEMGNAYMIWADQHFDLTFAGFRMPTTWLISYDSIVSFGTLVGITWFWKWRADRGKWEPDELGKLIIGAVFNIAGALCLYFAALTQGDGKIGLIWPAMFHLLNDIGFGHVLPVSLALVSKVSPRRMLATSVGIYYLSFFLANKIVGEVGGWYSTMSTPQFWLVHVGAAVAGLVFFAAFKLFGGTLFEGNEHNKVAAAA
ncbi:peptide MFS transporter [Croceibacterium aestuarii]|uniref:peptide MFS transporter n=1 Tax=Croceibacterium aestuarii TaxID=3064139 RepID=UPI00272DE049|nr:peptide MFS transporter [Croceibacterium sp. D39]